MQFPIIPVAAYIVPQYPVSHRLVVFSAWSPNSFGGERGCTQFAIYDHHTGLISRREVAETKHGMFCHLARSTCGTLTDSMNRYVLCKCCYMTSCETYTDFVLYHGSPA